MRRIRWVVFLALFLAGLGVVGFHHVSRASASSSVPEQLLQADRDFDLATAEQGADGWVSYFAPDGKMFLRDGRIVQGHEAIRELMAPAFADPDYSLRWSPLAAEASGELGYTYGDYTSSGKDKEGNAVKRYGRYVTIWKKQADGAWKVAADIGTPPAETPPPPPQ